MFGSPELKALPRTCSRRFRGIISLEDTEGLKHPTYPQVSASIAKAAG